MSIQEFVRRLGQEETSSRLMEALRSLRDADLDRIQPPVSRIMPWGEWT